ncbi:hypothetical protein ma51 [Moumouvirus australiensis]|uniref:Uncharacterized protein n=1 Tax=Moumouvirus australiensis TaxID=2109587 RepID=A0A2P1EKN4_9VIRU|nr:hypothetical protein QKC55_gp852 [Moumouvirus australiensis]AVL94438.1 hypothetical protein ma51 [Moumouvirus australiensis]
MIPLNKEIILGTKESTRKQYPTMSTKKITFSQRRAFEKMFWNLDKITDDQRDQMSDEIYYSFCQEYETLHSILWPSSTLRVPNRMLPSKREERNRQEEIIF